MTGRDTPIPFGAGLTPYYNEDGIAIFHGDASEVISRLAPGSVDVLLTDPPWHEVTHDGALGMAGTKALIDFAPVQSSDLRVLLEALAPACTRWCIATMDWRHIADLERAPPSGWRFIRFGIWVKSNGAPQFTGDRPGTGWEGIAFLHRDEGRMHWKGGGRHGVWSYPRIEGKHPTQKPEPLIREWIQLFSEPGDLVLDPYMGSGTTLRAAKDLGRRAIGIELEERWCEFAANRLSQRVFDLDGDAEREPGGHPCAPSGLPLLGVTKPEVAADEQMSLWTPWK